MSEEIMNTETVEIEVVEEETLKKEKKRTPKARKIEEILDEPIKSLTDKEKELLINRLKEDVKLAAEQIEMYKNNCTKAYEKVQAVNNEFDRMNQFYIDKLTFINTQLRAFSQAIQLTTTGGNK